MVSVIIWEDMLIRDERVFEWIKARASEGECQVKAYEIAEAFKCHHNTARMILCRLEKAGRIEIERHYRRGGFLCRIA